MGRYDRAKSFFESGLSQFDTPGPEIPVRPFAPGEVTAPAGIVKAITRLAAVRQSRANVKMKQDELAAERERRGLEVTALNQRIAAGQRTPRTLNGQSVDLTDAEYAAQRVKQVAPDKPATRVPLAGPLHNRYAKYLSSAQPNPDVPGGFTVDAAEMGNAEQAYNADQTAENRRQVGLRFSKTLQMHAEAAGKGPMLAGLRASLQGLDVEVRREGQAAYDRAVQEQVAALVAKHPEEGAQYKPGALEEVMIDGRAKQAQAAAEDFAREKRKPKYTTLNANIYSLGLGVGGLGLLQQIWDEEDAGEQATPRSGAQAGAR